MSTEAPFNIIRAGRAFDPQPNGGESYPSHTFESANKGEIPDFRIKLFGWGDEEPYRLTVFQSTGDKQSPFVEIPLEVTDNGEVVGLRDHHTVTLIYPHIEGRAGSVTLQYESQGNDVQATLKDSLDVANQVGVPVAIDWLQTLRMYAEGTYQNEQGQTLPLTAERIAAHPLVASTVV
jgi:hypothetical protein